MTPQDETLDQSVQRLGEHFTYDNITSRPQFKDLSHEDYENLIQFIEIYGLLVLSLYLHLDSG